MIYLISVKSKRSDHSKITENIKVEADITIMSKISEFRGRSEYMHSPNPVFKLTSFILGMFEGRSKAHKETISSDISSRGSSNFLSMIGRPYRFGQETQAINSCIGHDSFKTHLSQDCIPKEAFDV